MSQTLTSSNLLDEYMEIGATQGFEPIPLTSSKIAVGGRPGRGKTTFVMGIPRALVLDYDRGAKQCRTQHAIRVDMKDVRKKKRVWALHDEMVTKLFDHAGKKNRPFDMVVFDTLDTWFYMEEERATVEYNASNPGEKVRTVLNLSDWGAARADIYARMCATLRHLHSAGYGYLILYHIVAKKHVVKTRMGEETVTRWEPALGNKLNDLVNQNAEIVTTIDRTTKRSPKVGGKRGEEVTTHSLVFSTSDEYPDAKHRLRLPESRVILPEGGGWSAFEESYNKGIKIAQEEVQHLMDGGNTDE